MNFLQVVNSFVDGKLNLDLFKIFAIFVGGIVVVLFVVVSIILNHHWGNYGVTKDQIKKLRVIYFTTSGILLIIMVISLIIWFV